MRFTGVDASSAARATLAQHQAGEINVSQAQAGVGQSWDYEFNWFGLVISGNSKCTEYTKASVYQFKTVTGNPSTWTYRFQPAGKSTRLTLEVDFELPQSQLARFAAGDALEKMNRNRAREIVDNLKALIEP